MLVKRVVELRRIQDDLALRQKLIDGCDKFETDAVQFGDGIPPEAGDLPRVAHRAGVLLHQSFDAFRKLLQTYVLGFASRPFHMISLAVDLDGHRATLPAYSLPHWTWGLSSL